MIPPTWDPAPSTPPEGVSDRELVSQVQAGNIAAFGKLFQRYNARLCTYLARLVGDDDLGRDFAQDAFAKALEALLSTQEEVVYFRSWLYRIAINIVRDHWRHSRLIRWIPWPQKELTEFGTHEGIDGAASEEQMEEAELVRMALAGPEEQVEEAELVRMALAQVSPKYRPCLLLEIVEELPQREIARFLGISERSVRRHIKRGYDELCEAYQHLVDERGTIVKRRPV